MDVNPSAYIFTVAGLGAVFPRFVAVLLMLIPASDGVTRGELCHPPQPCGLAMADGSETQKKM